jgi:hypothetical protein
MSSGNLTQWNNVERQSDRFEINAKIPVIVVESEGDFAHDWNFSVGGLVIMRHSNFLNFCE